jgi:hypothetical protein
MTSETTCLCVIAEAFRAQKLALPKLMIKTLSVHLRTNAGDRAIHHGTSALGSPSLRGTILAQGISARIAAQASHLHNASDYA